MVPINKKKLLAVSYHALVLLCCIATDSFFHQWLLLVTRSQMIRTVCLYLWAPPVCFMWTGPDASTILNISHQSTTPLKKKRAPLAWSYAVSMWLYLEMEHHWDGLCLLLKRHLLFWNVYRFHSLRTMWYLSSLSNDVTTSCERHYQMYRCKSVETAKKYGEFKGLFIVYLECWHFTHWRLVYYI